MEAIVEFTDHDRHMINVLDNLSRLRGVLASHAEWLDAEWGRVSDEPMPFFKILEEELPTGAVVLRLVFVLRETEVGTKGARACG